MKKETFWFDSLGNLTYEEVASRLAEKISSWIIKNPKAKVYSGKLTLFYKGIEEEKEGGARKLQKFRLFNLKV